MIHSLFDHCIEVNEYETAAKIYDLQEKIKELHLEKKCSQIEMGYNHLTCGKTYKTPPTEI